MARTRKHKANIAFFNYMHTPVLQRRMHVDFVCDDFAPGTSLGYVWIGIQEMAKDASPNYAFNLTYRQAVKLAEHLLANVPPRFRPSRKGR